MGMLDTLMREALKKAGEQGGKVRASKLNAEERSEIARRAVQTRWAKAKENKDFSDTQGDAIDPGAGERISPRTDPDGLPVVRSKGYMPILGLSIPCCVLDSGQRVLTRTGVTEMITGVEGGGSFEKYMDTASIRALITLKEIETRSVKFRIFDIEESGRVLKGLPSDLVLDICRAFIAALELGLRPGGTPLSERRLQMASRAGLFLGVCAGAGLDTMIDEATGYEYARLPDPAQQRTRSYLAVEIRQWEEVFPEELWTEFARLTGWKERERPRSWSRLLCEMVYDNLDGDLANWLRENRPQPRQGRNFHQWLGSQPAVRRLVEQIWVLIGVARGCATMLELRDRIAQMNGLIAVQVRQYVPLNDDPQA